MNRLFICLLVQIAAVSMERSTHERTEFGTNFISIYKAVQIMLVNFLICGVSGQEGVAIFGVCVCVLTRLTFCFLQ